MAAGISIEGYSVEEEFRKLTRFCKPKLKSLGDAELSLNGETKYIEVKKVSSDTLNQVRPVKYSTLVAKDVKNNQWYVVPPQFVVAEAIRKNRGQHSESPLECCNLRLSSLTEHKTEEKKLEEAVQEAIRSGDALEFSRLKELLQGHVRRIQSVVKKDLSRIQTELQKSRS